MPKVQNYPSSQHEKQICISSQKKLIQHFNNLHDLLYIVVISVNCKIAYLEEQSKIQMCLFRQKHRGNKSIVEKEYYNFTNKKNNNDTRI